MPRRELNVEDQDTIEEAFEDFARHLVAANRSERTVDSYREAVVFFAKSQAARGRSVVLAEISNSDVTAFITEQLAAHKASSAAVRFRSLRALFNWLVKTKRLPESPMLGMSEPASQAPLIDIISPDVMRRLLKASSAKTFEGYRDSAILRLFYDTGMRVSEMAGLQVDHIDRNARTALVLGKGSRFRVVPFGDTTERAIRYYLRARETHKAAHLPALWIGQKHMGLTRYGVEQIIDRRCRDADIPSINPHRFRHTAAAMAKAAQLSEGEMMTLFGWRSTVMVHRYGKIVEEQQALEAYRRVGAPSDSL